MLVRIERVRLGIAVAITLLAGASAVAAQEPTPAPASTPAPAAAPAASACSLTLDPQTLKPQADPFQIKATLSQSIGDAVAAEIQEPNSGIDVSLVPAGHAAAQAAGPSASSAPSAKNRGKKPAANAQAAPAPAPAAADASASSEQVVNLRLATGTAKAGDYTLALKGATGSCTGKITLEGAAPAAAPTPNKP